MYIQITDACNMKCDHCCFSCTTNGSFMTKKVFVKACDIAKQQNSQIKIGGGEPTLHKHFWEFIQIAITKQSPSYKVWLATNGSNKKISISLSKLAQRGILNCTLSIDEFHNPISPDVIRSFREKNMFSYDGREIRITDNKIINSGRAKLNNIGTTNECTCNDMFISPTGLIYACGCRKDCFGTVFDYKIPKRYSQQQLKYHDCCSNSEFQSVFF